ncbi:MAG: DUF4102 domain-containing protein [Gammaproteobacteria bacterium]|nr:DUF4102 domain-containing protein [Gammaproteobacteria bacterium]
MLRLRSAGKRQPLGLGRYPEVTLAEARERAQQLLQEARKGVDLGLPRSAPNAALRSPQPQNKRLSRSALARTSKRTQPTVPPRWGSVCKEFALACARARSGLLGGATGPLATRPQQVKGVAGRTSQIGECL